MSPLDTSAADSREPPRDAQRAAGTGEPPSKVRRTAETEARGAPAAASASPPRGPQEGLLEGVHYSPPVRYRVLSQTGLSLRLDSDLASAIVGRLQHDSTIQVAERRLLARPGTSERLVRVRVVDPLAGWTTELPRFLALGEGEAAPEACVAAPSSEPAAREAAAFNELGEDLRLVLNRDCPDLSVLSSGLDVARLCGELQSVEAAHGFLDKTLVLHATQEQGASQGWSSIPLRSIGGELGDAGNTGTGVDGRCDYLDTPLMSHCPYIRQVIDDLRCPGVFRVRLMRLRGGAVIGAHKDYFESHRVVRLHLPLVTNPAVEFHIRDRPYRLSAGSLYFTNVRQVHRVTNKSTMDRIHLVIDVDAPPTLLDRIWEGATLWEGAPTDVQSFRVDNSVLNAESAGVAFHTSMVREGGGCRTDRVAPWGSVVRGVPVQCEATGEAWVDVDGMYLPTVERGAPLLRRLRAGGRWPAGADRRGGGG